MQKWLFILVVLVMPLASAEANKSTREHAVAYIEQLNANMPPNSNATNIAKLYTETATMVHGFEQHEVSGRSEIEMLYTNLVKEYKYKRHEIVQLTIEGNRAVIETWNIDKPNGNLLERKNPIIFHVEFDDKGLVSRQNVYIVR
jgi:hypothetical protein